MFQFHDKQLSKTSLENQVLPRDSDPRRRCLAQLWIPLEPRSSDTVWCKEFEVLFYLFCPDMEEIIPI